MPSTTTPVTKRISRRRFGRGRDAAGSGPVGWTSRAWLTGRSKAPVTSRSRVMSRSRVIQRWTTGQVSVRVMPGTAWTLATHQLAQLVDALRLGPDDHVVGAGDVLGERHAGDLGDPASRRRRPCRPRSGSGCTPGPPWSASRSCAIASDACEATGSAARAAGPGDGSMTRHGGNRRRHGRRDRRVRARGRDRAAAPVQARRCSSVPATTRPSSLRPTAAWWPRPTCWSRGVHFRRDWSEAARRRAQGGRAEPRRHRGDGRRPTALLVGLGRAGRTCRSRGRSTWPTGWPRRRPGRGPRSSAATSSAGEHVVVSVTALGDLRRTRPGDPGGRAARRRRRAWPAGWAGRPPGWPCCSRGFRLAAGAGRRAPAAGAAVRGRADGGRWPGRPR